ncbi:hypothetical protein C2E23DRAFT_878857 [Lenzites betulinus]|nr:hypothetical protein C2E23DRAFT_878857 [Lenzites betulinus]
MAPRPALPIPTGSFYPSNDAATHRDLLLFEERLKTTAASLNRRKRRYQLFLLQLLIIIAFLLCEVVLQTNLLGIPYTWLLRRALPELYPAHGGQAGVVRVHPYFASGLLFVAVTTLVLFFASGMYSEKIGYANKYVPHANRSLRNFNMHLNMRQPPLRSKLPFNPFAFLFARPTPSSPPSPTSPTHAPTSTHPRRNRSPSPSRAARRSSSVPIPPIPPASNPRGELIFSSRVDRGFRDAYDRYRAQFERRRAERERAARAQTWTGALLLRLPWVGAGAKAPLPGSPTGAGSGAATPVSGAAGRGFGPQGSARGRVGSTPPSGSRKSSPVPGRTGSRKSSGVHAPPAPPQPHPLAGEVEKVG